MGILYFNKATLNSYSIFLFELNQNTTEGSHGKMFAFWFYTLVFQCQGQHLKLEWQFCPEEDIIAEIFLPL